MDIPARLGSTCLNILEEEELKTITSKQRKHLLGSKSKTSLTAKPKSIAFLVVAFYVFG